ncbi:hypothetical protein ILUMI_15586 [Ignelater luminosus]|uniref:DDE-1 domain-containing protein n=1 Tax=Ignelater luminosus TaxID=2038154 RepID=A0A8K0CUF6_IGNLU|nr:hypothetical protein ILUMI_15586 [Ignelater luminosus]
MNTQPSYKKKFLSNGTLNQTAGIEWMRSFMKRRPRLSLREAENTSIARVSAFNKHNVDVAFNIYTEVQAKYIFEPSRIWNTDETGISTVIQALRVIEETGKRVFGQCVSTKRGTAVTFCGIISAAGGSKGYGTKSRSPTCPVLLLLDNHKTQVSVDAINYARNNGIVLLSFPPHCMHKMQPLDKVVYGPFEQKCKIFFNDYVLSNPGKPITIYDIAKITSKLFLQGFTSKNIISGFLSTGWWSINRLSFADENFVEANATDRPDSKIKADLSANMSLIAVMDKTPVLRPSDTTIFVHNDLNISEAFFSKMENPLPTIYEDRNNIRPMMRSILNEIVDIATRTPINIILVQIIKPANVRPFPKAGGKKTNRKSGLGKSKIYTSSPEKARVEELEKSRKLKLEKTATKKKIVKAKVKAKLEKATTIKPEPKR